SVRQRLDPAQLGIDEALLGFVERLQRLQNRLMQGLGLLRPVSPLGQCHTPGLEIELPAARRHLADEVSVIECGHGVCCLLKNMAPCVRLFPGAPWPNPVTSRVTTLR